MINTTRRKQSRVPGNGYIETRNTKTPQHTHSINPFIIFSGFLAMVYFIVLFINLSIIDDIKRRDDSKVTGKTTSHHKVERRSNAVVTLSFMGDVAFRHQSGDRFVYALSKYQDPFSDEVKEILQTKSDWTMANLETSIVEDIDKIKARSYVGSKNNDSGDDDRDDDDGPRAWFASDGMDLKYLQGSGINAVTVANNHWFDVEADVDVSYKLIRKFGVQPLVGQSDLFTTLEGVDVKTHSFDRIQIGPYRAAVFTTNVALDVPFPCQNLVSTSNISPCLGTQKDGHTREWNVDWKLVDHMTKAIRRASSSFDIIIISIHWGTQFQDEVHPWQIRIANLFQNASKGVASLIVGHHPHRLHGIVHNLRDTVVAYSLGSTLWMFGESHSSILQVKLLAGKIYSLCIVPTVMERGVLHVAHGQMSSEILNKIGELSSKLHETDNKIGLCK